MGALSDLLTSTAANPANPANPRGLEPVTAPRLATLAALAGTRTAAMATTQHPPLIHATAGATSAQQGGLKALALAALGRNNARNNPARHPQKSAQHRPVLHFRLPGDPPNAWATAIGERGETRDTLAADLRGRWPGVEVRS